MERGRSHEHFERTAAWRRQAFTLAALIAVFLQAFVVQTHIHAPVAPLAISASDSAHNGAHATEANEHQLICAICQALATTGAATLPGQALVLEAAQTSAAAAVALALAPRVFSHSWRSRAPPSLL